VTRTGIVQAADQCSQYTNRQFAPEEATLGEFFAFLDRVEWDVIPLWRFIKHVTKVHGQRPHGESFYLGE
jgi:hypothetical protein